VRAILVPVRTDDRIWPPSWPAVLAVSAGGVVGALARFGLQEAFPHRTDAFGWATWAVNVVGCLLIGALMPLVGRRPLLQPFVGPGFLGGFTTFSAYAVDVQRASADGAPGVALLYLGATLLAALVAVWAGATVTEAVIRR
jgi:CrcB protein